MLLSKKHFFSLVFICFAVSILAQSKDEVYQNQLNDLRKTYFEIEKCFFDRELDKALAKIERLDRIIKTTKTKELYPIIDAFYSHYFLVKKDSKKALTYARKSIDNSSGSNNNEAKSYANFAMAIYFHTLNDHVNLSEYSLKALNFAKKTDNHKLLGDIYYRLYCVHTQWDDLKTDEFAQKALDSYKRINDYNGMVNAYSSKVFGVKNQFTKTNNSTYKDSVLYYLRKGVSLGTRKPKTVFKKTRAMSCLNLANYFREQYIEEKVMNKSQAIDSIYKYLSIVDKIPPSVDYDYTLRSNSTNIKSDLALYENDLKKAEMLFLNSFHNLKSAYNPNYYPLFNTAVALKQLYVKKRDYQQAYEYLKAQYNYNELIYDKIQSKKVKALEAKFENQKIKQALIFEKKENKAKKIELYLSIGLLIIALIAIGLLIKIFKNRIVAKQQKLELLNKEKVTALAKVKLQEEQYARLLAEQKVLEIEKEKVQKKAIANAIQIERKNQLLKEIQQKIEQNNLQLTGLKNTLKLEKHTEEQLNNKLDDFKDVNPEFFEKLKEISGNKLTDLDLKYCAYFYLGLSNREIANNLNIEAKSVRMTKYRIKKKLNLNNDLSLEDFITEF